MMNRTQAFSAASDAVRITRNGQSGYAVIFPYHDREIDGPSCTVTEINHPAAQRRARIIKARVAAALLGATREQIIDAQYAVDCRDTDWREAVRSALA